MFGFFKNDSTKTIRANEIDGFIGNIQLIDIREPFEFKGGSIQTATNIPMGKLLSSPDKCLLKDKTYYIVCQTGARSRYACKFLEKKGFDVINVVGGVSSYTGTQKC